MPIYLTLPRGKRAISCDSLAQAQAIYQDWQSSGKPGGSRGEHAPPTITDRTGRPLAHLAPNGRLINPFPATMAAEAAEAEAAILSTLDAALAEPAQPVPPSPSPRARRDRGDREDRHT